MTSKLPRFAPLGTTQANPGRRVWSTAASLLRTFVENVAVRIREGRDQRRLQGEQLLVELEDVQRAEADREWLEVRVVSWESARRR